VGKPEGRRPLERPRRRREGLDGCIDCIDLDQDRDRCWPLVNAVINLQIRRKGEDFLGSLGTVSFSGRTLIHGVNISNLCKSM
jgi:hypothetical protein